MKKLLFAALLCLNLSAQTIINGEAKLVLVEANKAGELKIDGKDRRWLDHPTQPNLKFALVAASYHKKGIITLENKLNGEISTTKFKVIQGKYKKEQIAVEDNKVNPPKDVLKRIETERTEASKIYASSSQGLKFSSKFELPMSSAITSPFGTARVFNGSLKSYHGGTDFRAAVGEVVLAANDGVVAIAKDRYYAGGSVVIDHGEGIYTQYYHLSRIDVAVGQVVKKGEAIALSGASGRVSGPHLHFGVIVSGVQVEPLKFIDEINLLFAR